MNSRSKHLKHSLRHVCLLSMFDLLADTLLHLVHLSLPSPGSAPCAWSTDPSDSLQFLHKSGQRWNPGCSTIPNSIETVSYLYLDLPRMLSGQIGSVMSSAEKRWSSCYVLVKQDPTPVDNGLCAVPAPSLSASSSSVYHCLR